MKLATRTKALLITLIMALGITVAGTATESAQAVDWNRPSREYRNGGGWIPIYPCPTTACNPTGWVKSGSTFYMDCYEDWQWYYGNYNSNRWFYGYNGYWGYVHSSFVYNQIGVRHC